MNNSPRNKAINVVANQPAARGRRRRGRRPRNVNRPSAVPGVSGMAGAFFVAPRTRGPRFRKIGRGTVEVENDEYWGTVGTTVGAFKFKPGGSEIKRLDYLAKGFSQYQVKSVILTYAPRVGTSTAGRAVVGIDYDGGDKAPTDYATIVVMEPKIFGAAWQPGVVHVDVGRLMKSRWMYTTAGGDTHSDLGVGFVAYSIGSVADQGDLYVKYRILLSGPIDVSVTAPAPPVPSNAERMASFTFYSDAEGWVFSTSDSVVDPPLKAGNILSLSNFKATRDTFYRARVGGIWSSKPTNALVWNTNTRVDSGKNYVTHGLSGWPPGHFLVNVSSFTGGSPNVGFGSASIIAALVLSSGTSLFQKSFNDGNGLNLNLFHFRLDAAQVGTVTAIGQEAWTGADSQYETVTIVDLSGAFQRDTVNDTGIGDLADRVASILLDRAAEPAQL